MPQTDALTNLTDLIRSGLTDSDAPVQDKIETLFGERYHAKHFTKSMVRNAYKLGDDGVPFAGLIHPDNPPSGPYGGTSLVWFPSREHGSIIDFGIGTRGLPPDEGILTRPGHRRRIAALRRYLARRGVEAWSKPDPTAMTTLVPRTVQERFPGFDHVFKRYGREIYCTAQVPSDPTEARQVVQAFLDLYAFERGWEPLKAFRNEYDAFIADLRSDLFLRASAEDVNALLRARRFVVLQGPPGTGKTRLAGEVAERFFAGRRMVVQFHPAVTYEDFIVGLAPAPEQAGLRFDVRPGWLLQAARQAREAPFLLVIDEINRADLGKILGEAIHLFEADEVSRREVTLPHPVDGQRALSLPENLFVLATMNTADRSIAALDLAIRRRFAFVPVPPDRAVVAEQGIALATGAFDQLSDVFVEHAPDEALDLLPGHAYFLAKSEPDLRTRFRYELLPLLDEYLRQGLLGPATGELHAVRDAIQDRLGAS